MTKPRPEKSGTINNKAADDANANQPNSLISTNIMTTNTISGKSKLLYIRMLRYAWRYKLVFAIGIVALVILSATNTGFLATIKKITDEGFAKQSDTQFSFLPLILFGLMALRAISGFCSNFSMRWVARHVVENLRRDAFKRLMQLPIGFFDGNSAGLLVSKLTYDCEQVSNACTKVILTVVRDSLTAVGIVAYMLYLDWRLTLIFAIIAPLMGLYLKKMTPKLRNVGKYV